MDLDRLVQSGKRELTGGSITRRPKKGRRTPFWTEGNRLRPDEEKEYLEVKQNLKYNKLHRCNYLLHPSGDTWDSVCMLVWWMWKGGTGREILNIFKLQRICCTQFIKVKYWKYLNNFLALISCIAIFKILNIKE